MAWDDFAGQIRRQMEMAGGRDRRDCFSWAKIADSGETEVLRVNYASPRLLAVQVFVTANNAGTTTDNDIPNIFIDAGTDNGTIRFAIQATMCRALPAISPAANGTGADQVMYPPQAGVIAPTASPQAGLTRVATPTLPIQIPAQSLRVCVTKPPGLQGTTTPIYASAIVAPVYPDALERYAAKGIEMLAAFMGGR